MEHTELVAGDLNADELGRLAFEVYVAAVGGRDVRGGTIPQWEALSDKVRHAWMTSAMAIVAEVDCWEG